MSSNTLNKLIKEVCGICEKDIRIGQTTAICCNCDRIFHGQCIKPRNFTKIDDSDYCAKCADRLKLKSCKGQTDPARYNPFYSIFNTNHSDKFYEDEPTEFSELNEHITKVLEGCQQYDSRSFTTQMDELKPSINFSTLFLNLDGNKTNFDELAINLSQLKHKFSVIGLAETNISI